MTIEILNKEYGLSYGFKSLMIFENITGHNFEGNSLSDVLVFFFSSILAANKDVPFGFDEFIAYLDEKPERLVEFSSWLTGEFNKQHAVTPIDESQVIETQEDTKKN